MIDALGEEELELEPKLKAKGGIPGFERLNPEEQNKKLVSMFREVFSSPHGKIVLGVLLEDLYMFSECTNDEARTLRNYATTLLSQRLELTKDHMKVINRLMAEE